MDQLLPEVSLQVHAYRHEAEFANVDPVFDLPIPFEQAVPFLGRELEGLTFTVRVVLYDRDVNVFAVRRLEAAIASARSWHAVAEGEEPL